MTQAIEAAITQIAATIPKSPTTSIVAAPTYPPEKLAYSPFAITYLASAHIDNGPVGTRRDIISVAIDVLIPIRRLDDDLAILTPLHDPIHAALQAQVSGTGQRFSNTITAWDGGLTVSYIPDVDYAGVHMRGYRYLMEGIKILVNT